MQLEKGILTDIDTQTVAPHTQGQHALELVALHKSFGADEILKGIDLQVARGELVFVLGPSGSGKSTMLRCCNRLEEPDSGEVRLDGQCITTPGIDLNGIRRQIGMVFQAFNLYPHLMSICSACGGPMKTARPGSLSECRTTALRIRL